jgi:hypothetical protein|tara:strand:- start:589 stop:924 length:336 start_codon:yes stop_codon:yes gene_type:complete
MFVPLKYVNVYLVDRAYGGPQEGGWWFTYGTPAQDSDLYYAESDVGQGQYVKASVRTVDVEQRREAAQAVCDALNDNRRSDIGSVLSEGRYEVAVESHPPKPWPEQTPYYE